MHTVVEVALDQHRTRGFLFEALVVDRVRCRYVVYVPRDYHPRRACPSVLFLHGRGESGSDGVKPMRQGIGTAIQWSAGDWPFIVIFPQKHDADAEWEDDDDMVMAMLAKARKQYNIDATRIYLTGISQGGHGTWAIAAAHADTFAAIAPVCGYVGGLQVAAIASALESTPVWAFHGLADTVVPPSGTTKIVEAIKAARAPSRHLPRGASAFRKGLARSNDDEPEVRLTLYAGVEHNSWDRAYRTERLGAWFLSHRRR